MSGPLAGVRVVEFAGIGPGPFATMLLADFGADVVRIARPDAPVFNPKDFTLRGRRQLAADLKQPQDRDRCLQLLERADVLIEGFRPGVMERLGLGPEVACARNPRLIYGRMTGWGQTGPLAQAAGHDINYIAVAGALGTLGEPAAPPAPPLNLLGDFGGGALYLALGVCAALVERAAAGQGQVIDAAIVDGTASLMTMIHGLRAGGLWSQERADNLLDGGAPYYRAYACADGKHVAVGALEPQFYAALLQRLGLGDDPVMRAQDDRALWPEQRRRLAALFAARPRDAWCALTEGADACLAPVLSLQEAARHPHNRARGVFHDAEGEPQPAPAPRLSRTPGEIRGGPTPQPAGWDAIIAAWSRGS